MYITRANIENFKSFAGKFSIEFNKGLNILVGNNEAGKSSILEAIHLALTGVLNGKYLKNELTQYLFNSQIVSKYIDSFKPGNTPEMPPSILIELFIESAKDDVNIITGDGNSEGKNSAGITFKIAFDDKYQLEYQHLISKGDITTIPIEYYEIFWESSARQSITSKSIPLKSALIDSSSSKFQNGSNVYISRIVKEFLDTNEVVEISQAHRKMKDGFMNDNSIQLINKKIQNAAKISNKEVKLSVELSSKNAWETSLITYLDDVPFHYIGKGEQCIIKTKLALGHKKTKEANIILLEEPENHLAHAKLNQLISEITDNCQDKQIIVSTHSSFVANKLGLKNLILLNGKKTVQLAHLTKETQSFFERLAGYDTLRLILCKKAILVEGDSDELIIQKAYMQSNNGKLPIQDEVDVISVGTAFLRFLEIAERINKDVVVVTDNDGDISAVKKKYLNYIDKNAKNHIKICYDETVDTGSLLINDRPFNYNTLEPKLLKSNGLNLTNKILGKTYTSENIDELMKHMKENKTESALKFFEFAEVINFPAYILDAIK